MAQESGGAVSGLIRKASKCILSAAEELGEGASQEAIESRALQLMKPEPEKSPPSQKERVYRVISHASNQLGGTISSLHEVMKEVALTPDGSIGTDTFVEIKGVYDAMLKVTGYRLR